MSSDRITIKRLHGEVKLLEKEPLELVQAYPMEDNMYIWYFIMKGPIDTDYFGGYYIGKIMLSHGYPQSPVDFMMLTPSGRFEIGKKICLTNSGYHSDQWTAMWNMRTIILAFLSIMSDDSTTGISHIKESPAQRKNHALNSFDYNLRNHSDLLKKFTKFVVLSDDGEKIIRMKTHEEVSQEYNDILQKDIQKRNKKLEKEKIKKSKEEPSCDVSNTPNLLGVLSEIKEEDKQEIKEEKKVRKTKKIIDKEEPCSDISKTPNKLGVFSENKKDNLSQTKTVIKIVRRKKQE
jgi:ubiquitin-conjugating enzyme E2 J1